MGIQQKEFDPDGTIAAMMKPAEVPQEQTERHTQQVRGGINIVSHGDTHVIIVPLLDASGASQNLERWLDLIFRATGEK